MTEQDTINAVATALTGVFYAGQLVRRVSTGAIGRIIDVNFFDGYANVLLDGSVVELFFWGLEPV